LNPEQPKNNIGQNVIFCLVASIPFIFHVKKKGREETGLSFWSDIGRKVTHNFNYGIIPINTNKKGRAISDPAFRFYSMLLY
jgi:hypothetical protein